MKKWLSILLLLCISFSAVISAQAAEPVTIRFSTWDGGTALEGINKMVESFMAENPGIKVEVEYVADQYIPKMLAQIAGGSAPDIMQIGDVDIVRFAKEGYFEPLDAYFKDDPDFSLDDFYASVIEIGTVDGSIYALPAGFSCDGLYYNKDLFDKAGLAYPTDDWTWDDMLEAARKLTVIDESGRTVQWGLETMGAWVRMFMPFVNSFGGELISPDGSVFTGYMNSEGTLKALEFYRGLYYGDNAVVPNTIQTQQFVGVDMFQAGLTAMKLHGVWFINDYTKTPGLNYGTARIPSGPNGLYNILAWGGYGINANSANKDAAWRFYKYLTGREGALVQATHHFPGYKDIYEELGWTTDEHYTGFIAGIDAIVQHPELKNYLYDATGGTAFQPVMDKLLMADEFDIKAALDEAAAEADRLLEKELLKAD